MNLNRFLTSDEVCVLSASGTAAVVKLHHTEVDVKDINHHGKGNPLNADESKATLPCRVCHIPYSKASIPFPINLSRCAVCRQVLFFKCCSLWCLTAISLHLFL